MAVNPPQEEKSGPARFLALCYDFVAPAISIADVTSDILIAIEFYKNGQMGFFIASCAIIAIASASYVFLFLCILEPKYDGKKCVVLRLTLLFIVLLPFAQLIPFFIWIQSYQFKRLDAFLEKYYYVSSGPTVNPAMDPLHKFILQKLRTHGGFWAEAVVESVPQAILQMIAVVMLDKTSPLIALSIGLSLISVASKGIAVSYSIDRKTFAFATLCVLADVFNVFAIVSWLFYLPPGVEGYNFGALETQVTLASKIWMFKEVILMCLMIALLVGVGLTHAYAELRFKTILQCLGSEPCECFFVHLFVGCLGFFLLPVVLLVIEALKFSLVPFIFERGLEFNQSHNYDFFSNLYKFLGRGDFERKLAVANKYISYKYFEKCDQISHPGPHPTKNAVISALPVESLSPKVTRIVFGLTANSLINRARMKRIQLDNNVNDFPYWFQVWVKFGAVMIFTSCIFYGLSIFYGIIYPFICISYISQEVFKSGGLHSGAFVQIVLTLLYFSFLALALCLLPFVIKFKRTRTLLLSNNTVVMRGSVFQHVELIYDNIGFCEQRNKLLGEMIPKIKIGKLRGNDDITQMILEFLPDGYTFDNIDLCRFCFGIKSVAEDEQSEEVAITVNSNCFCDKFDLQAIRERLMAKGGGVNLRELKPVSLKRYFLPKI